MKTHKEDRKSRYQTALQTGGARAAASPGKEGPRGRALSTEDEDVAARAPPPRPRPSPAGRAPPQAAA